MRTLLPFRSRILTAIAAVVVLGAFVFPLWRVDLEAPQYPEGIGMLIHVNTVTGVKPQDLNNINGLNHYIGMKPILPEMIPELKVIPWIVGALSASGLLIALWGRQSALIGWLVGFGVFGVAGIADFWRWGYDYGHDLDQHAIIQVPGLAYQPPLVGSKELLNFTAYSWPDVGGILLGVSFVIAVLALWLSLQQPEMAAVESSPSKAPPPSALSLGK